MPAEPDPGSGDGSDGSIHRTLLTGHLLLIGFALLSFVFHCLLGTSLSSWPTPENTPAVLLGDPILLYDPIKWVFVGMIGACLTIEATAIYRGREFYVANLFGSSPLIGYQVGAVLYLRFVGSGMSIVETAEAVGTGGGLGTVVLFLAYPLGWTCERVHGR